VLEYHTGLVSREYWQNVNETRLAQARAAEVKEEIRKRVRSREEVVNHMGGSPVPLNGAAFAQHLEGLASVATELRRELEASKEETLAQRHRLALVAEQQQIVSDAYRELTGDFEYLTEEVPDTLVECPTCGAQYENSVSERFSIARDASRCSQAMLQLAAEAKGAEALVAEAERSQAAIRSRFDEASRLLNEPVGDVQVKDLIRSESVREVLGAFDSLVRPLSAELSDLLVKVAELDGRRNALVDRKWRKSINEEYKELMASYLGALNVSKLPESCYRTIRSQVRDSGSENIRALIAQFAALLHIIARFGDTVLCPAVVDSPNQHGQDDVNMPAILEFLFAKVPRGMQMIVGVEKLHGVRVPGTVVRLTERDNLLRQEEFASITKLFDSYVVAMSQSA
jgi:chromosome segregation ATPase